MKSGCMWFLPVVSVLPTEDGGRHTQQSVVSLRPTQRRATPLTWADAAGANLESVHSLDEQDVIRLSRTLNLLRDLPGLDSEVISDFPPVAL